MERLERRLAVLSTVARGAELKHVVLVTSRVHAQSTAGRGRCPRRTQDIEGQAARRRRAVGSGLYVVGGNARVPHDPRLRGAGVSVVVAGDLREGTATSSGEDGQDGVVTAGERVGLDPLAGRRRVCEPNAVRLLWVRFVAAGEGWGSSRAVVADVVSCVVV